MFWANEQIRKRNEMKYFLNEVVAIKCVFKKSILVSYTKTGLLGLE